MEEVSQEIQEPEAIAAAMERARASRFPILIRKGRRADTKHRWIAAVGTTSIPVVMMPRSM